MIIAVTTCLPRRLLLRETLGYSERMDIAGTTTFGGTKSADREREELEAVMPRGVSRGSSEYESDREVGEVGVRPGVDRSEGEYVGLEEEDGP